MKSDFQHDVDNLSQFFRDNPGAKTIPSGFALSNQTAEQITFFAQRAIEGKVWTVDCGSPETTLEKLYDTGETLASGCLLLVVDRETTRSLTTRQSDIPEFHDLQGGWVSEPASEGSMSEEDVAEARKQAEEFLRGDRDYVGSTTLERIELLRAGIEYFATAALYLGLDRERPSQTETPAISVQ